MRLVFIAIIAIAFLSSCNRKRYKAPKPPIVYFNNAEPDNWVSIQTIKQSENAHSGKFVSIIDSLNSYSLGITKPLKAISSKTIDSVRFNYWVFLNNLNTEVKTVFSIEDSTGKSIEWIGIPIKEKVKENNKWTEITETFQIPANAHSEYILKLFVWNASKTHEALLDDFSIVFY
ncbi:MAG: hypothetical protein ACT4ON_13835 [Bacteroidota bacterium]